MSGHPEVFSFTLGPSLDLIWKAFRYFSSFSELK